MKSSGTDKSKPNQKSADEFLQKITEFCSKFAASEVSVEDAAYLFVQDLILEGTDFGRALCEGLASDRGIVRINRWRKYHAGLKGEIVVVGDSSGKWERSGKSVGLGGSQSSRDSGTDWEQTVKEQSDEIASLKATINSFEHFMDSHPSIQAAYAKYTASTSTSTSSRRGPQHGPGKDRR